MRIQEFLKAFSTLSLISLRSGRMFIKILPEMTLCPRTRRSLLNAGSHPYIHTPDPYCSALAKDCALQMLLSVLYGNVYMKNSLNVGHKPNRTRPDPRTRIRLVSRHAALFYIVVLSFDTVSGTALLSCSSCSCCRQ